MAFGLNTLIAKLAAAAPSPVPVAPSKPRPGYTGNTGTAPAAPPAGGGVDPALKQAQDQFNWSKQHQLDMEARAKRQQDAADRITLANTTSQADNVGQQIAALAQQLGSSGFKKALDIHLANALRNFQQSDDVLLKGFNDRLAGLRGTELDNEKAEADASYANLTNRSRERQAALTQAASQGAGESDTLKSEQMSLRNWAQNQSDVNRSYFDTLRSTNNSIRDLNADTRTARANLNQQLNQTRGQLYDQYYNNVADTYTQLGNLYNQQAQLYGNAFGVVSNPESGSYNTHSNFDLKRDAAERAAQERFRSAASTTGQAYKDPGLNPAIQNWRGAAEEQGQQNSSNINALTSVNKTEPKRPEGATLRKWA